MVHCWSILLKQKVGSTYCCVQYIEEHFELLDFLVVWYVRRPIFFALGCFFGFIVLCIINNAYCYIFSFLFPIFSSSYDNKEIALNCGSMLRECIKFPTLAKYDIHKLSSAFVYNFQVRCILILLNFV